MDNEDDLVPQNDYESDDWRPPTSAIFRRPAEGRDLAEGYDRRTVEFVVPSTTLALSAALHRSPPVNTMLLNSSAGGNNLIASPTQKQSATALAGYNYTVGSGLSSLGPTLSSRSSSLDRKGSAVRLLIVRQPELQHRARYLSEGSRGAIKDRSGSSNCTIQLIGYHRPTRVQMMAVLGNDDIDVPAGGVPSITPHPLYRLIPVSGKTVGASSCQKVVREDGMECIEIMLYPENNMTAILDCIGILKICTYDTKHRKRKSNGSVSSAASNSSGPQQHNSMRIFMRAHIPSDAHVGLRVVHAITESISCVQQLGVPEIYKISRNCAPARGGDELFIIGRNFDRNAKILFREYKEDGTLKWSAEAHIDKQYLHQCHIVCTVPPYINMQHGGEVSLTVVCSSKSSHPHGFVYTACGSLIYEEDDDWRPPGSPKLSMNTAFCLPDYEVNNHRDLTLLERNCCPSSFYDGGLSTNADMLSVTVPCSKVDAFTPQHTDESHRSDFHVTTALIHDSNSRILIGDNHLIRQFIDDHSKTDIVVPPSGHRPNSISHYQLTPQPIQLRHLSGAVGESSLHYDSGVNGTPTAVGFNNNTS